MSITLVHPDSGTDGAVNFARDCALDIIAELVSASIGHTVVTGSMAVRGQVNAILEASIGKDGAFLGFGHGLPGQLMGFNGECAFHADDARLLNNKVCYVLACYSFDGLSKAAIQAGAISYVGFEDEFWVPYFFTEELKRCCTKGIKEYLKGNSKIDEVKLLTENEFTTTIEELDNRDMSDLPPIAPLCVSHFTLDMDRLRFYP